MINEENAKWAWSQTVGRPEPKLVLVFLAMAADDSGNGEYDWAEFELHASMDRSAILKYLDYLVGKKFIAEFSVGDGGVVYSLLMAK